MPETVAKHYYCLGPINERISHGKDDTKYTNRLQICKNRQMRSKKALKETEIITKTTKIAKSKLQNFARPLTKSDEEMQVKSRKAIGETAKMTKTTKIANITKIC